MQNVMKQHQHNFIIDLFEGIEDILDDFDFFHGTEDVIEFLNLPTKKKSSENIDDYYF